VTPFSKEEIEADSRQPKRKVAVMLGYSGSGYKGMQMMPDQPTIEGDLFKAFVAAGAISKANADDPKKSSFVRCARTDKGVHAAGNVISLKLIIEDPDIIKKINEALSPQIRVWGIERTTGSFSCYQACDSRWYEYLIPTYCYLPPHPKSYMGKKLVELADEVGDLEGFNSRQEEVAGFWDAIEARLIKPILDGLGEDIRTLVEEALYRTTTDKELLEDNEDDETASDAGDTVPVTVKTSGKEERQQVEDQSIPEKAPADLDNASTVDQVALNAAIKSLKAAYISAKKTYRIPKSRLMRIKDVFAAYEGTHNYHNYTVRKPYSDPSAKRHILSFAVNPEPITIGDTEWISLKVHGQSFMMHQIRKMVGMATLMVRCGTPLSRLEETFAKEVFSIPKAPGLGLLLERPVFNNYNSKVKDSERETLDFSKYEKEINEFKHREIYDRIFREEEQEHV
jgi:tRNA pseudouridine38-40 synthase